MREKFDENTATQHLSALAAFDSVIFSTQWLADRYAQAFRELEQGVPEIHVCGNHIDPEDWPEPIPRRGPLRVGWMGSPSHRLDLPLARLALQWAYSAGHEVRLIGYDPGFEDFTYYYHPWKAPGEYGRPALPLDIMVIPLARNRFNLGKSDVKVLEAAISGCAVVCSPTVYGETIKHEETGLLAGGPEELRSGVERLARDPGLRQELADNLQQYVREERLIQHHVHEWERAVCG
jgi:glycosyltransferase involved in cell wall biosynthesis